MPVKAKDTEKQKVDTRDLKKNMYVSELDRPWIESPFIIGCYGILAGHSKL